MRWLSDPIRSNNIDPLLSDNNDILFLPETVAAFSAQNGPSQHCRSSFPEFDYKEAALDPDQSGRSAERIGKVSHQSAKSRSGSSTRFRQLSREREVSFLTIAFPLTIKQKGCLTCHSTPDAAPPAMIDLYGPGSRIRLETWRDCRRADYHGSYGYCRQARP